jgi:hypothetical protein
MDFVEILKTREGGLEPLPIDIDQQVMYYLKYGKITNITNADVQKKVIEDLTHKFFRDLAAGLCFEANSEKMMDIVSKVVKKINVPYIRANIMNQIKNDVLIKHYIELSK